MPIDQLYESGDSSPLIFQIAALTTIINASYLIHNDWIASESVNTYMGIDLSLLLEDPVIGPGLLAGVSYRVHSRIAFFGEAGLNLFLINDVNDGFVGMHNTGVGMRVIF